MFCIWCVPACLTIVYLIFYHACTYHIAGSSPWGRAQQPGHDLVMSALRIRWFGKTGHDYRCVVSPFSEHIYRRSTEDFSVVIVAVNLRLHFRTMARWKLGNHSVSVEIWGNVDINGSSSPKFQNNLSFAVYEWQIWVAIDFDLAVSE
jgi:hypothetical protein